MMDGNRKKSEPLKPLAGARQNGKQSAFSPSRRGIRLLRMIIALNISIFMVEVIVMLLFSVLPPFSMAVEAVIDSTMLTILVFPCLYILLLRPLVVNITERSKAEKKLRKQNEFLNTVLESLTHPFCVIDANDYTIKIANSALYAGKLPEKTTCYMLSHKRDKPCNGSDDLCPFEEIKKTKRPVVIEHVHYDKDGNPRNVEVHAYPIFNGEGNISEIIEYSLDITERQQQEDDLRNLNKDLVLASRRAGMAEVATDVLHNVGNVLNSINISASFIEEKISDSKVINLKKVTDILAEHADDLGTFITENEQGKHIPVYLTEAVRLLLDEQADITEKLRSLTKNIEHTKQIIKAQQGYSKASVTDSLVGVKEIVEDAVEINSASLKRHGVDLKLDLVELPKIYMDQQRVLQILVNLISNGKYALCENIKEKKLMVIRCYKHGNDKLRIEVTDNGVGISKENMSKMFTHGFTTREHGHGFGLHSSALAAKEMGGSLTVQSDGPGQGATFILELLFKSEEVMKCPD